MQTQEKATYPRRRFTTEEYHRLAEIGVLHSGENVELLNGLVYEKYTDGGERRFTAEEYHAMLRAGILHEDDRTELIEGRIYQMAAVGSHHAACVKRLNRLLTEELGARALVSVQDPIRLPDGSEPEPDLAVLRPREDFYAEAHPTPGDLFFLIEVADTTLAEDRAVKIPAYALHGVSEAWLVALRRGYVEVYRRPMPGGGYAERVRYAGDEAVQPAAFDDLAFSARTILGP